MVRSPIGLALLCSCALQISGCSTISDGEIEPGSVKITTQLQAAAGLVRSPGWHQWRGPRRDGVVDGLTLPKTLPTAPWPEAWRVEVGMGFSGVIAADGLVFCHARAGDREIVSAHDAVTGGIVWSHANTIVPWSQSMFAMGISDGPLTTPTYVGGRLFTVGIHGLLQCLDASDGTLIFSVSPEDLDGEPSEYRYGHASSPLVWHDTVYVPVASGNSGSLLAIDAATGELRWRVLAETVSYASPVAAKIDGVEQVVVRSWDRVVGLDPPSGRLLWSFEAEAGGMRRDCATPLVVDNVVYLTNEFHGTHAIQVVQENGTWRAKKLYRTGALGGTMASPLYYDGHLYGLHKRGRFVCVDAATGKRVWGVRAFHEYVSMIAFDGRALVLDDEGRLVFLQLNPQEHRVVAEWSVGEYTWAHLGVDESHLYFRDGDDLVALKLEAGPSSDLSGSVSPSS